MSRLACLLLGLCLSVAAAAQTNEFDIPAGSLDAALAAFGAQAGVDVNYDPALAEGKRSRGVTGPYTPQVALKRLLQGSGTTFRFANANTVALARASETGAAQLSAISVVGERNVQSAYDPVDGYVAERSAAGTKTDTALIDTPRSVSVISRDRLETQNVGTLTQILGYTPGVVPDQFGLETRTDRFGIRGFDASVGGLYLDGLALPSLGDSDRSFRIEPYGAERIAVLRGPSSALYGSGSPGGLVNVVSKRPTTEPLGVCRTQGPLS